MELVDGLGGVGAELVAVLLEEEGLRGAVFERVVYGVALLAHAVHFEGDAFLVVSELDEPGLEGVVARGLLFAGGFLRVALLAEMLEPGGEVVVGGVEGVDAGFCGLELVEVRVDDAGLLLAEADKVDDVGKDLDQAGVGGLGEIGEGKVIDTTLTSELLVCSVESIAGQGVPAYLD